mgnify:CR=1 FL=1
MKRKRRFVVKASRNIRRGAKRGNRIMASKIIVDGLGTFTEISDAINAIERSGMIEDYENGDIDSIQYTVVSDRYGSETIDAEIEGDEIVYQYWCVTKRDYNDDWLLYDETEYATFDDAEIAARKLADRIGYDNVGVTHAYGTLSQSYGTDADYEFDEDGDLVEVY